MNRSRCSRQRAREWTEIVAADEEHDRLEPNISIRFPLFISAVFKNLFGNVPAHLLASSLAMITVSALSANEAYQRLKYLSYLRVARKKVPGLHGWEKPQSTVVTERLFPSPDILA